MHSQLAMRRIIKGYILLFTRSDHDGRHVHVFKDNREIGVYDRILGPIRGLEEAMSRELQEALDEFTSEINERGL